MIRATFFACLAASAAGLVGCGAPPPTVPDVPPAQSCQTLEPPAVEQERSGLSGPGLARLRPGAGPGAGLPMTVPQLISMRGIPSDAQWRALPPTADAALVEAAEDATAPSTARARALAGLAIRGAEAGGPRAAALLGAAGTDPVVRRAAARAIGAAWVTPAPGGADQAPALIAALTDPDPLLRETAVKALAPHLARADLRAALEARQAAEAHDLVKDALKAALAQ